MALIVLSFTAVNAQNYFDIRLKTHSIDCETNEVCYDVQIKSGTDRLWRYAGQNYRMLYNGALAEFLRVEQILDDPYAPPALVQDLQHMNLSEDGSLAFDADISWLNYFTQVSAVKYKFRL